MNHGPSNYNSPAKIKAAAAENIALEASRLARIAYKHDLALLAHLIDMVVLEAWREASEPDSALGTDGTLRGAGG